MESPPPSPGAKCFLYIFTAINWSVSPFRSFYRQKWQISLPFQILQVAKSLPFCIPEAWRRYPFPAEPPHTGNYREQPPPLECLKQIKQHIELATQTSLITLCYKSDLLPVFSYNFVNRDGEWSQSSVITSPNIHISFGFLSHHFWKKCKDIHGR